MMKIIVTYFDNKNETSLNFFEILSKLNKRTRTLDTFFEKDSIKKRRLKVFNIHMNFQVGFGGYFEIFYTNKAKKRKTVLTKENSDRYKKKSK